MNKIYTLLFGLLISSICFAQSTKNNLDSISQELVNPIGGFWTINDYFDVSSISGNTTNETRANVNWMIQLVAPIPLNKSGLKLMNRPQLPIMLYNPSPSTGTDGTTTFNNNIGIGDFVLISSLGKMGKLNLGMFMWGAGFNMTFPT